jgi:hypothetical protein
MQIRLAQPLAEPARNSGKQDMKSRIIKTKLATVSIDDNPKTKYGQAKPGLSSIPQTAIIHLGLAMENGRNKYGLYNWREKTVSSTIYVDAAWRHLASWMDGEDVAEDSGVHHLGHVMACCAILLDAFEQGKLNDNRGTKGKFPEVIKRLTKTTP